MATWKKVIVSGSAGEFTSVTSSVLTDTNLVIAGVGGALENSGLTYDGTTLDLGSSQVEAAGFSGSFSGSFQGDGSGLTGVVATNPNSISQGTGIVPFSYNGLTAQTVAVSGAAALSDDIITKWDLTDGKFVNSSLTDNGTSITGTTSLQLSGANSSLTGSFSGSFVGTANLPDLTSGIGIDTFTYDGSGTATVALANGGALQNDTIQKWDGGSGFFVNSGLVEANNVLSSIDSIQFTGAATSLTGSFTGSFTGDGSGLTGLATTLSGSTDSGDFEVNLLTQTLTVQGTANEIETSGAGQTITIGLPNDVIIGQDLTVNRNLTVLGTASFQNTTNLDVADRFILLASGSNTGGDGGIVVQQGTQGIGEAFAFDLAAVRWGITGSFDGSTSTIIPDAFMAAVVIGSGTDPNAAPARYVAAGNMFIGTDESIYIYS
jgi:hypothetical protein